MSLVATLFTGVSGLLGNAKAMNVIGDNIANVNTVGFKSSKAVFGDVFSQVLNNGSTSFQVGLGTQITDVIQSQTQGAFTNTTNALDIALDGEGFFIVSDGTSTAFTRAGQFFINDSGLVESSAGNLLQGQAISQTGTLGSVGNIDLSSLQSSPQATTELTLGANLNAAATAASTFTTPATIVNSSGAEVVLNITWTKVAGSGAATYTYSISPSTGTITAGGTGTIAFGPTGQLSTINGGALSDITVTIDFGTAANTQNVTWNLVDSTGATNGKLTGFAAESNNSSVVQDGFTTGTLIGLAVNTDGIINGSFSNGQNQNLFQISLAKFLSPTGLSRSGSNLFTETADSGQPVTGIANTGGFGGVVGQTLELSNVDLATEFTNLIQTQQAFQANARIISTTDDMLTETVNLVR